MDSAWKLVSWLKSADSQLAHHHYSKVSAELDGTDCQDNAGSRTEPSGSVSGHATSSNLVHRHVKTNPGTEKTNVGGLQDVEKQHKKERRGYSEDDVAHVKALSWKVAGLLQIGDVVGTGILALGSAVAKVGYIPAALFMCSFLPINIYAGYILQDTFLIFPNGTSLDKMAQLTIGKRWLTKTVQALYYSFMVGVLGQYVQVLASCLESLFLNTSLCHWQYVLLSVILLLPFIQFRTLNESSALQVINTLSITFVVFASVGYMILHMDKRTGSTTLVNVDATWQDIFSSLSKFVFAFNGNTVYLEFLAEMKHPETFYKAFYIAGPYQFVMYTVAAFAQYSYYGDSRDSGADIFKAIPTTNPLFRICAFLLFIHMICAYLVKGTILARVLHVHFFRRTVNDTGFEGRLHWFLVTVGLAGFAFLISNAIPNFNALIDLLASFQTAPLGFILPPLMLLSSRRSIHIKTSLLELLALAFLIMFGIILTTLGTAQSILAIDSSFTNQPPFYCRAETTNE